MLIGATITGSDFLPGAMVTLTMLGEADVVGSNVNVQSSTTIVADFDLTGVTLGLWDVTVENPSGLGSDSSTITAGTNDTLDIFLGAALSSFRLRPGARGNAVIAGELEIFLQTLDPTFTAVYDDVSRRHTFQNTTGAFTLRFATGPNAARTIGLLLGWDSAADYPAVAVAPAFVATGNDFTSVMESPFATPWREDHPISLFVMSPQLSTSLSPMGATQTLRTQPIVAEYVHSASGGPDSPTAYTLPRPTVHRFPDNTDMLFMTLRLTDNLGVPINTGFTDWMLGIEYAE